MLTPNALLNLICFSLPIHNSLSDVNETRLKLAKEIGATSTLLLDKDESPAATAEKVIQLIGKRPDYAIDCVGFEGTITTGLLVSGK